MSEQTPGIERPVPHWVGLAVAIAIFGGLVVAGAYWVWDMYTTPSRAELIEVPSIPQARISTPAPQQAGIQKSTAKNQLTYTIKTPDATLSVSRSTVRTDLKDPWAFTYGYNKTDLMTSDQNAAAQARYRLLADPAFAKSLKVTPEQLAQLKQVPAVTTMIVSDADQALVQKALDAYAANSNPTTEQALIKAVSDTAAHSLAPTRANIVQRVKQIQGILTAEQIKAFKT